MVSKEALAAVPLFRELAAAELELLAAATRRRRYKRGEVIFLEGDPGAGLCIIESGRVNIVLRGEDGRELVLNVYGPGEFFGEFALLDGEPRSADAVAQDACLVHWLRRQDFLAFLESHPRVAWELLAVLSRRLRHTTRVAGDATFRDAPARLARALLELAAVRGRPGERGTVLDGRLTQSELAAMIGATRETVNKSLRSFQRRGLLTHDRGTVTILLPDGLRKQAR
jgi:CRP/FNR family cyclic AMP-dependent transcriptional regulator